MRRTVIAAALAAAVLVPVPARAATPSPTPSTSPSATPTATPTPTGSVTATFRSGYCGADYGWFVTNSDSVSHTLTLTENGVSTTFTLAPGETRHIGNANRGDGIRLVDDDGDVLIDSVGYDCIARYTTSVTVTSGSAWTRSAIGAFAMAPAPQHGTVLITDDHRLVRYTPDPCFVGGDAFGFKDVIVPEEVVVHVTVVGPAVGCVTAAPALGSGQTSLPFTGAPLGPLAGAGALVLLLGTGLVLAARPRRPAARR